MHLTPEQMAVGKENFCAAVGSHLQGPQGEASRREVLKQRIKEGHLHGAVPGHAYFGYEASLASPLRVGVIGTGDEGSVLIGAINPDFIQVRAIADIRPYNKHRAFHGDYYSPTAMAVRPGLIKKYGYSGETQAREKIKVYDHYRELIANAGQDEIEAVIIALPLHLHAPAAIAAMKAGLHVLTEKLMAHSVHECKEMARIAKQTGKHLATGHQRHYNILYDHATDIIRRGLLGDLHYIRAQWHRANLPGKDSWQQPMPKSVKPDDPLAEALRGKLRSYRDKLVRAEKELDKAAKDSDLRKWKKEIGKWKPLVAQVKAQIADEIVKAEQHGYQSKQIKNADGTLAYDRPAIEELIRWRLWDRTGGGLMAELGSHQLDAASIFIAAVHGGRKQYPLCVGAASNRALFPADRDVDDHVFCMFEFPAPGYDPKDPHAALKKIGVQYASINGNGYGGYGETVLGTRGTLQIDREKEAMLWKTSQVDGKIKPDMIKVRVDGKEQKVPGIVVHEAGDPESAAFGQMSAKDAGRGYQEQLEHWAWCVRKNPDLADPDIQPKCHPKLALGDAVIALTTNRAARSGERIEFKKEWFDIDSDETPEGVKPNVKQYES